LEFEDAGFLGGRGRGGGGRKTRIKTLGASREPTINSAHI